MRRRLLAEWAEKYERIEDEIKRCEKQLITLERQQKELKIDMRLQIISLAILFPVMLALVQMGFYIPWIFLYFYIPVLSLLAIFTLGRGIFHLFKTSARLRYHKRTDLPFQYPKPLRFRSNYPTYIPPNYYTEQLCLEWLIKEYRLEMSQLKKLRKEIEQASEEDYTMLQENLDNIIIYEIVGRAK